MSRPDLTPRGPHRQVVAYRDCYRFYPFYNPRRMPLPGPAALFILATTFLLLAGPLIPTADARIGSEGHLATFDSSEFSGDYRGLLLDEDESAPVGSLRLIVNSKGHASVSLQVTAGDRRVGRVSIDRQGSDSG